MGKVVGVVAQVAFGAIGSAIGGPIGWAVGTLIGGALFGPKQEQQPASRLSDLGVQGSEYGTVIPIFYGGQVGDIYGGCPTAGNIIDANPAGGIEEVVGQEKQKTGTAGSAKSQTITTYNYFLTVAVLLCEGPQQLDELWADEVVLYNRYAVQATIPEDADADLIALLTQQNQQVIGDWGLVLETATGAELSDGLRIYPGNHKQLPDTALQAFHDGVCPAYRGVHYFVLYQFALAPYNNRVPTFRGKCTNGKTLKREIVELHMKRAGVPAKRINLQEITGELLSCFQTSQGGARDFCEKLAAHSLCDLAEFDGKINDLDKTNPHEFEIPLSDLACRSFGQEPVPNASVELQQDEDIPSQVSINFIDINNNYEPNSAYGISQFPDERRNESSSDWPIVDNITSMVKLAQIGMDEALASRYPVELSTLPKYIARVPGNVAVLPDIIGVKKVRISKQNISMPGALSFSGTSFDSKVYTNQRSVDPVIKTPGTITLYGKPTVFFKETVPFVEEMADGPCAIAAATTPATQGWNGAYIYSFDPFGFTLGNPTINLPARASIGASTSILYARPDSVIDYSQTLTVHMVYGELGSCTEEELVTTNANAALLDDCLIRWTTATEVSANVYELTGLLYGQFGSDYNGDVPSGSQFLLLTDESGNTNPAWTIQPIQRMLLNRSMQYDVFSANDGVTYDLTTIKTINIQKISMKPLSPVILDSVHAGGDITIRWQDRTRFNNISWWSTHQKNPSDSQEMEVVLKDGSTEVYRQRYVFGPETPLELTFDAALLTAYYGYLPSTISGELYQVNNAVGRGFPAYFTDL